MKIGGLQKISLIDYPGKIAAILFAQGCNFRCSYCHNPELLPPEQLFPAYSNDEVMAFLKSRIFRLEGIVISGGEPTLQPDLPEFLEEIKSLGYLIKLDTNGSNPAVLAYLLKQNLLDFAAMDIKAPLAKYERICGVRVDTDAIRESIRVMQDSGIACQFRMTLAHPLVNMKDAVAVQKLIPSYRLNLQGCQMHQVLDESQLSQAQYSDQAIQIMQDELESYQEKSDPSALQISA